MLHPEWSGNNVTQNLGNNGKMSFELPGDLVITKNIDWGNASDQTKENQKNFTFQVNLNGDEPLDGNFAYEVYGSGEDPVSNGAIADNGTVTIEAGQRVVITGLPAGTTYTVTEQGANSNGFTTTDNSVGDGANTADGVVDGMIVGGSQQSATFTNTYNASTPVNLSANTTLSVQKVLDGRDWRDDDSFTFNLSPVQSAPASSKAEVVITDATGNNHTDSFGDITFTAMGEYRYTITEANDDSPIVGIDYSAAVYRVTVNVVDGGNGKLAIGNVSIEQLQDDEGAESTDSTSGVQGSTVTFTNRYLSDQGSTTIDGTKVYDDTTGGNNIDASKFTFRLEALGGYDTGNKPGDGSYTYAAGETPMPAGAQNKAITTGNSGNEFHFPTIYFDGDDVGRTYEYKVTEVAGNEQGMGYDDTEYTLLITVTEEHDGQGDEAHAHIVATPSITPTDLKFTNTYDPADATLTGGDAIHGTKVLNGRSMNEGETFYFQLTQTGGTKVLDAPEIATVSAADGDMNFNFSDMTFSQTGDYTFTVNEVADANGAETTDGNGLVYSQNLCTVTVHVDDNEDGTLSATVEYSNSVGTDNSQAVFTNTYAASMDYGDKGGIVVTKQLLDRNMAVGDFDFIITGEGDAADLIGSSDQSFENAQGAFAGGTVSMSKLQGLTFDQDDAGKTYIFTVDEVDPAADDAIPGVVYDKSQYRVEIEVVDNGDGSMHTVTTVTRIMSATGGSDNAVVVDHANSDSGDYAVPTFGFVNDYNPNPAVIGGDADTALQVTKTVTGAPSPDGVGYNFTLTAQDTAEGPIANIGGLDGSNQLTVSTSGVINAGESQTVSFGQLTFSAPGTYTFTVQEDAPAEDAGWTYDTTPKTVCVVVTDRNSEGQYDGNLYIQNVTGSPVAVTNSYEPGSVTVGEGDVAPITVQKTVSGSDTQADFSFQLVAVDPANDKWDNVEVVDQGYDGSSSITEDFSDGDVKTATFGGIRFNAAGEYQFKIVENDTDKAPGGWTYDKHEATVTVTVTDQDFDGQLDATVTYDNTGATTDADKAVDNAAAFTNSYSTSSTDADTGSAEAKLTKVLEGKVWDGDSFTFEIKPESNTAGIETADMPMPNDDADGDGSNNTVTVNAPTEEDGKTAIFSFGSITFDTPGTYVYKVTEVAGGNAGIDYSSNKATITIEVVDNHQGALVATVGIENNVFTNTYASELDYAAGGGLEIIKTFENADMREFNFTVTPKNEASADKLGIDMAGETFTTKSDATIGDDDASHAEIMVIDAGTEAKFTQDDADDTYTYTVQETKGDDASVTYDGTVYTVTITTVDDGLGGIKVTTTVTNGADYKQTYVYDNDAETENQTAVVPFTNTYKAEGQLGGNGAVSINATKTLTNRPMVDGEFKFNVINAADDSNTVVATGTNDANGTINFSAINYSIDQMLKDVDNGLATPSLVEGKDTFTYTYKVTEDTANLDDGVSAIDTAGFQITVTVTDNGDGTLKVEWSFTDAQGNPLGENASITFNNTYTAQPTSVSLGTGKLIEGRALAAGEFTFKLADADGNEISTATNEENGAVTFDTITYDTPGDYTYTITEVAPQDTDPFTDGIQNNGVTYDESVYNATVKVTDNGKGNLTAQISYSTEDGTAPLFVNTYTPPAEPEQGTDDGGLFGMAKTGDFMGGMMAVIAAVIAAAAGGAAYAVRKMRRPRGRHAR
ncbi:rhs family protein [Cryptobacterium sp. CAG:338]|nr:rhs family protein [Cryptobacterium sp. CAG:338]